MTDAAFLVELTLRATAVLLAATLVAWLFRRRSASVRHVLWIAAFSGLLALPVLSLSLPAWRVLPAFRPQAAPPSAVVATSTAPPVAFEQLPPPSEELHPIGATVPAASPVFTPRRAAVVTSPTDNSQRWPETQTVLLSLWATGFILFLTRIAVSHFWMRSAVRRADVTRSGPLRAALDQLTLEFGWNRRVDLVVTRTETMPMACGLITPTILLPPQSKDWTGTQGRSVLLHEFGHILRRDPLWKLVIELSRAVYWFHPLAWLAARWAAADRERACDDLVLRSGVPAGEYARHLLDVVSGGRLSRFQLTAGVAMASTRRLDRRLRSLMHPTQDRRPLRRLSLAGTLVAAPCLLVPIAMVQPSEPPPSENARAERERETDDAGDAQGNSGRWWSSGFLPGVDSELPLQTGGDPIESLTNPAGRPDEVRQETLDVLKALNERNRNDLGTETRIQRYERAFRLQAGLAELSQGPSDDPEDVFVDPALLAQVEGCLARRYLIQAALVSQDSAASATEEAAVVR